MVDFKCKFKLRDVCFSRYKYNNSQAFYEPLLGEHVALYSKKNNARVLMLETNNDVEYTDAWVYCISSKKNS